MSARIVALAALVMLLPLVAAHGEDAHTEEQLVEDGKRLVVGEFTAPQAGDLIVVPYVDGPLPCGPAPGADYRIPMGEGAGVAFAANATALQAFFDEPASSGGYTALAVDTHAAARALILMQENAVSLHGLAASVRQPGANASETRTGALGLPYPIPGTAAHDFPHTVEGQGIVMDHDGSFGGASVCAGDEPGHVSMVFRFDALPEALGTGRLVHVVALRDPSVAAFLPRPLDDSTTVLRANLYLAQPGEDPVEIREALDPSLKPGDALPLVAIALGLVLVARR